MRIALTALTARGSRDMVITGDEGATVGQVAAVLRKALGGAERLAQVIALPTAGGLGRGGPGSPLTGRQETLWVDGQALDPGAPASGLLRDGAVVTLDPRAAAGTSLAEPSGLIEVRVTGGPGAGTVHRLGLGTVTVGASPDCAVRLSGLGMPAYAARLSAGPGGSRSPPSPSGPTRRGCNCSPRCSR